MDEFFSLPDTKMRKEKSFVREKASLCVAECQPKEKQEEERYRRKQEDVHVLGLRLPLMLKGDQESEKISLACTLTERK